MVLAWVGAVRADYASLHGRWSFQLDPDDAGIEERWYETRLSDSISLPGSTDERRCGEYDDEARLDRLSRPHPYVGPAWYQRDIDIPPSWKGRRIILFLERAHWETQVWLDDAHVGMQDSLCTPHIHDLSELATPGRHRLTVRVDNRMKYNVGDLAHSVTEETQTNWNGIIGEIELRASDPVWLDNVQIYPDMENRRMRIRLAVGNRTKRSAAACARLTVRSAGLQQFPEVQEEFNVPQSGGEAELEVPFGTGSRSWDEFTPALYDLTVTLAAQVDTATFSDTRTVTFGLRSLATKDRQLLLNGRGVFLRGTVECCVFPLTGYPAMDIRSWTHIFQVARAYGLNHMRFHSWCPPEAAFRAADEAGFLLQVEAPQWVHDVGDDAERDAFVTREVRRILDTYGNHPSFGMLCMGNELGGDLAKVHELVESCRQYDPRHLYASSSGWGFGPKDDYAVPFKSRGVRGPGTDHDFREIVAEHAVPCITHEVGQWTVFPNFDEMSRYTGVLKPRNFEIIRDALAANGMADQSRAFTTASGQQAIVLYKEEIESQLRTPGIRGFQLLSLTDFPGQGTALVGVLDAFWESKGFIEPRAFRRFCGPTVPLLRLNKRVFTADETLVAQAEVAHYGPTDLLKTSLAWSVRNERGGQVAAGSFPPADIRVGGNTPLGEIKCALAKAGAPAKLVISIGLPQTGVSNTWNVWVYPKDEKTAPPKNVEIVREWNETTQAALAAGKRVLLLPSAQSLGRSLPGSFKPVFWSPLWFKQTPATMSILCDPSHPALARFPTDGYSDWQWYDLLESSRSMILDDLPADFRPVVQVIDNFARNHRLGNLLEARVGKGRLMICSLDLESDLSKRPAARQMLASLLSYMSSDRFEPAGELSVEALNRLFEQPPATAATRDGT